MPETIFLKPLTSWEKAQKTRAKLSAPLRVLTSLKTTAVLGAVLGTLLAPATALKSVRAVGKFIMPKTIKGALIGAVAVPTAVGVLSSSPKLRKGIKTALDPRESVKRGKALGEIIEDPKKTKTILGITEDMTTKEKVLAGLKKAGKFGAIIAGAGALAVGVKKVLPTAQKILAERKAKKEIAIIKEQEQAQRLAGLKQVGFTEPQRVGLGGIPVATPSQIQPVGAPQSTQRAQPIHNIIQIAIK